MKLKKILIPVLAGAMVLSACGTQTTATTAATTATATTSAASVETTAATTAAEETTEQATNPAPVEIENIFDYVVLGQYIGVEVPTKHVSVTQEEIDGFMQGFLEDQGSNEHLTEGTVEVGSTAGIHFVGTLDGVAFEGGTGDYELTIGSGSFIDGFEDGLVGAKVGETVDLNLTFPDPYTPNTDLSGKEVVFTVTVNYLLGEEIVPAELNDEFAALYGYDSVDALLADVRQYIYETEEEEITTQFQDDAWTIVIENTTFIQTSDEIYQEYYEAYLSEYQEYADYYGMTLESLVIEALNTTIEEFYERANTYADYCMKQELVARAIVETEGFIVTNDEYEEALAYYYSMYSSYFTDINEMEEYFGAERLKTDILWGKALNLVVDKAVAVYED